MKVYTAEEELDQDIKDAEALKALVVRERNSNRMVHDVFYEAIVGEIEVLLIALREPELRERMKQIDRLRKGELELS